MLGIRPEGGNWCHWSLRPAAGQRMKLLPSCRLTGKDSKEERTEAEQAQMAAKSEAEFQARKAKTAMAKLKASRDQVGP